MGRHTLGKSGGLRVSDLVDRPESGADERYAQELAAIETPAFAATRPAWPDDPPTVEFEAVTS